MLTCFDQHYLEEINEEKQHRKSLAVIDAPETEQEGIKNQCSYVVPDNHLYRQKKKMDQMLEIAI